LKALRLLAGVVVAAAATVGFAIARIPWPPDFFLYPVADTARGGAPVFAMLGGLVAGLAEDALTVPGRLLGLHAFSKVLIGYFLATIGARTVVEKPIGVGVLLAGAVFFESAVLVLLLWVLRGEPLGPNPAALAARATTTGAVGMLLHHASRIPWRARREARRRRRLS
jgi:rod shape-determining protein MreD